MSAIFGIFYRDGRPVEPRLLEKMSNILAHRGSDATGVWHNGSIGLGNRMLWTTPESLHEKLPKVSRDPELVITADARLDNREELLRALGYSSPASNNTVTDSEIILSAYKKWGEQAVSNLLGDFAFAIWDKRKQSLFCARDHFGVKSINYFCSDDVFVFATEIKALFALEEIPRVLNEIKVFDYLEGSFDDVSSTFFQNIFKLPAGSSILANRSNMYLDKYWSASVGRELRRSSNEDYAEEFREVFVEAVRCRMKSDYSVGSMLSGGLDSSSITCTARELQSEMTHRALPTFSSIFPTIEKSNEHDYIKAAVGLGGLNPSFLEADKLSPLTNWKRMTWHLDEALFPCNSYMMWGMYEAAKKRNVRVILDGFDGDTTVSHGLAYFQELAHGNRWWKLAKEIRPFGKNYKRQPVKLFLEYFNNYRVKPAIARSSALRLASRTGKALMRRTIGEPQAASRSTFSIDNILNPDFGKRIDTVGRRRELRLIRGGVPTTQKGAHLQSVNSGVMQYILEVVDRSASAFGIEARFPFWDKRLVEFCLALPTEQKIQNGWTRFILRNAMAGILPKSIQWRGAKTSLGHAFTASFSRYENERIKKLFQYESETVSRYIDTSALRETFTGFKTGNQATADELVYVWRILTLSLWLDQAGLSD